MAFALHDRTRSIGEVMMRRSRRSEQLAIIASFPPCS